MESELKQILKLEGLDKVKALAAYTSDVTKSLAERTAGEKQLRKALDETFTAQQLSNGAAKDEQKIIAQVRNERSVAHREMKSQKEEERDIYFRIGMELRTMMRASAQEGRIARETFGSLGGYLGEGFSQAATQAFTKFDELKFAFEAAEVAGGKLNGKLGSILTTIGGFGLPIAALATGVTLVVENFKKLEEAATKAREEMRKTFTETATDYFNLSKQQQVDMRKNERANIESEVREWTAKRMRLENTTATSVLDKTLKEAALLQIDKELADRQRLIRELDVKIKKILEDIREERKKTLEAAGPSGPGFAAPAAPDVTLMSDEEWFWANHAYNTSDFFHQRVMRGNALGQPVTPLTWNELQGPWRGASMLPARGAGMGVSQPMIPGTLPGVDLKPENWGWASQVKGDLKEIDGEAKAFADSMKNMMGQIAGTITSQIGGAFRKVFGEGENLAADLFTTIVTTFLNFGLTSSFRGMGLMAGGGVITEPYIAKGLHSGSLLMLGEKGPEVVTPMNRVTSTSHSRGNADVGALVATVSNLASTIANGRWRASGMDLRFISDKASRVYAATKM